MSIPPAEKRHDLPLDVSQIHLWCCHYTRIADERLLEAYRSLLSEPERERALRFHFERDRHRYLVTRALVRTVLSQYADVAPEDWTFTTGPHGRPEIGNEPDLAGGLRFNVSHTEGLIVVAVGRERAVGVDAEDFGARPAPLEVVDSYFSGEEATDMRQLPQARRQRRFFEYWTLKEAYVKALGGGLSLELDRFAFRFPAHEAIEMSGRAEDDRSSGWHFCQLFFSPTFVVAICAERMGDEAPGLVVRQAVPLVSQHVLDYETLRASAEWRRRLGAGCS